MDRPLCALPGCTQIVPAVVEGRPPRRYCSPDHHREHRAVRRGASAGVAEVAATAPAGSSAPTPVGGDAPAGSSTPRCSSIVMAADALRNLPSTRGQIHQRRFATDAQRRAELKRLQAARVARGRRVRRLVGVAAAMGVLATGGTVVVKNLPAVFDPDHVPRAVAQADWEAQAKISLASIDSQLTTITATEAVWDSQIAALYPGAVPAAVTAMLDRKTLLQQQRAALQGQLATLDQLASTQEQLAALDRQIAEITTMLDALPAGRLTPDQQLVRNSLTERRDLLRQQRSARQDDLTRLRQGVQSAETSPIPDPTDQTSALTARVLDLREHRPTRSPSGQPPRPPITSDSDRRDAAVLADGASSQARKPVTPIRPVTDTVSGTSDAVTQPVRDLAESSSTPRRASSTDNSGSNSDSSRSGSSDSGSSGSGGSGSSGSDSSDSSGSGSSATKAASAPSTSDSSDSGDSGSGGSGGSGSSGGSGMSAADAYRMAMNTPQGRMASGIGRMSGSPMG
ncbi:hypothetical protein ACFPM0_36990 [Pseudonocardia sulfidoxydans]